MDGNFEQAIFRRSPLPSCLLSNFCGMFAIAAIATDDFLFGGEFGLIKSWYDAGVPVEFHLYQNGGHGFGLGNPDRTSNTWFDAFIHWLDVNGFTDPKEE